MITVATSTALIMLALINPVRPANHQLVLSADLSHRAEVRAEILCKAKQWSHENWLASFNGLPWYWAGENLAKDFETPQLAEEALMNSPTHKDNIVNPNFTKLGVGEKCGIIVQLFESDK